MAQTKENNAFGTFHDGNGPWAVYGEIAGGKTIDFLFGTKASCQIAKTKVVIDSVESVLGTEYFSDHFGVYIEWTTKK